MSITTCPTCWIIAGPNGSGKTTFALTYLPMVADCYNFINADLIAAGLSPLAPEAKLIAASRLFLQEIQIRIHSRRDFAFETTLSGRSYLKLIRQLKSEGWHIELIYLALPSVEMSRMRVAERVAHGGHNIPLADIQRRFSRSLYNLLYRYSYVVDHVQCFMNHGDTPQPVFIQQSQNREIISPELFQHLIQEAET